MIDRDLEPSILSGRLPLQDEWSVELDQLWGLRSEETPLVLLASGLCWHPSQGRDPQRPRCCPLPESVRPILQQLAAALNARLVELDGSRGGDGLGRNDLLEAPLLLVATERAAPLLTGGLLRAHQGQLLSLIATGKNGRLWRERRRALRPITDEDLELAQPPTLLSDPETEEWHWMPEILLTLALILGLWHWWWSGRVVAGLALISASWWWLRRQPCRRESNRRWCREQLLVLQRLWADFGLLERVRDQLQESRWPGGGSPSLLQELQAHRLHLELERPRPGPWHRVDLIDALQLFHGLRARLRQGERRLRRRRRIIQWLAGGLVLAALLAMVFMQDWADVLVLPTATLLCWFSLRQPIPVLPPGRRSRALKALSGPLAVLEQAQRCDELSHELQEVEIAVLTAGRELVDVVNDCLSSA